MNSTSPRPEANVDSPNADRLIPASLNPAAQSDVDWFVKCVGDAFKSELIAIAIYGPATTSIFDRKLHRIHTLIVRRQTDTAALLELAKSSVPASDRGFAPPLVVSPDDIAGSKDVFPLEWMDMAYYHVVVAGDVRIDAEFDVDHVRLQCERDLRALRIVMQRGILASGGREKWIDRLERDAADSLIRVLRGIAWLGGDRHPHLPAELPDMVESVTGFTIAGCREAIATDGRHDLQTLDEILSEVDQMISFVDRFKTG